MFRNELRSSYGGMVGSAVHDHIIIAAPHLADGACVHAPVWAGYKRNLESLCIHKVPQTGTAEGSDGLDHLRGSAPSPRRSPARAPWGSTRPFE